MAMLFRLEVTVDEDCFDIAQAVVSSVATDGWEEASLPDGRYVLKVTSKNRDDCSAIRGMLSASVPSAEVVESTLEDEDWTAKWREYFTPVQAGDFLIVPPWTPERDDEGLVRIVVEPKSAFGTGHHPTTMMCLEAVSRLHRSGCIRAGQTFLDMGTGTGVLGMGCVKLGLSGLGADIDPLSISNSRENSKRNGTTEGMQLVEGSTEVVKGRSFDLVMANILAGPLREMAPDLISLVKPGGSLILSGFLAVQVPGMLEAYAVLGEPEQLRTASPASDPTRSASASDPEADDWVCFFWSDVKKK